MERLVLCLILAGCNHGRDEARVVPATAPATLARLDEATALKVILADDAARTVRCGWAGVSRETDGGWSVPDGEAQSRACPEALQAVGLLRLGACLAPAPSGRCERRAVTPTGLAVIGAGERPSLDFPCGTIRKLEITSITMNANRATVAYKPDVGLSHEVVGRIKVCQLSKTETRQKERTRELVRDEAGTWRLEPLPPQR